MDETIAEDLMLRNFIMVKQVHEKHEKIYAFGVPLPTMLYKLLGIAIALSPTSGREEKSPLSRLRE
ncbi:MAG: hypothetical protein ABI575_09760, partial [Oxalobacteraceae bacterium]